MGLLGCFASKHLVSQNRGRIWKCLTFQNGSRPWLLNWSGQKCEVANCEPRFEGLWSAPLRTPYWNSVGDRTWRQGVLGVLTLLFEQSFSKRCHSFARMVYTRASQIRCFPRGFPLPHGTPEKNPSPKNASARLILGRSMGGYQF